MSIAPVVYENRTLWPQIPIFIRYLFHIENLVCLYFQVKGVLHRALEKVGRPDLAEDLLLEQVEGSSEKVAYQSIV